MIMPTHIFSTAFREQRLGLMFAGVMVILVYLGSLAMAAQTALWRTSIAWEHDLQHRLTVELPFTAGETVAVRLEKVDKLVKELGSLPEVARVHIVPDEEKERLLSNWISDEDLLQILPLPALIDIDLKLGVQADGESLRKRLSLTFQQVRLYGHAEWMGGLKGFLNALGLLALLMLLLTAAALVIVIAIICRAALSVQKSTIDLLHFLGAGDDDIARQFQSHIRRFAVPCALVGYGLAGLTLFGFILLLQVMDGLSLIAPLSWVTIVAVMTFVPVGAVGLALLAARVSVHRQLARLV